VVVVRRISLPFYMKSDDDFQLSGFFLFPLSVMPTEICKQNMIVSSSSMNIKACPHCRPRLK